MPSGASWPRISIVTPSYNQGQYLEETIRSILLQGYPNLEYIIIDGQSGDESLDVIRKYASWLSYWVSEPDAGQSCAINKGFARCTGEIVTFCGSDDIYLPGTLRHVALMWSSQKDSGAIVGSFHRMDDSSKLKMPAYPPELRVGTPADLTLGPPNAYRLHQAATFFTRQALQNVGFWVREDMKYAMDRELLFRVCRQHKILITDRPYAGFRSHGDSKSRNAGLSFYREFAQIYLDSCSGTAQKDALRKRMASLWMAKAHAAEARRTRNPLHKVFSLLIILYYQPNYVTKRSYFATWRDSFLPQRLIRLERRVRNGLTASLSTAAEQ